MKFGNLIRVFYYLINPFLFRWPASLGGYSLRRSFWKKRFAYCGENVNFGDDLVIDGFPSIEIGDGVSFMSRSYLYANDQGCLSIGSRCSFNHGVFLGAAGGEVRIGDDVLVGPNVVFRASDHVFENPSTLIRCQGHRRGKIVIGNNVWLAANVVVTAGVTIGDGCVVGAGSVVTHDLPAMTLCVGSPARVIRSRV
jgi:galactoside O-acetyltransferase